MHIANPPNLLRRLAPKLVPQQTVHAHLRLSLHRSRFRESDIQHLLRFGDLVHNAVLQRFLARPPVRLEQHLACDLRAKFEAWQEANAGEVQAEIDGRHAEETARSIHDTVVVREGKGAGAAEGVASQEGDSGEGVVEQCC